MNADADKNKVTAFLVKVMRVIGKRIRIARGDAPAYYPQCTDLTVEGWNANLLPDVVYGAAASDLIFEELAANRPSMICRFGTVELATISSAKTELTLSSALRLLSGDDVVRDIGLHTGLFKSFCKHTGFFPPAATEVRKFVAQSLEEMSLIDILCVWCKQERDFSEALSAARKVRFRDLEPYMHVNPWSRILAGKKVLVVHPFAETIADQYARKRTKLFANPLVLPEFELKTIKAVQSIANNQTPFTTWFDALDHMKAQISASDFDIAIIGCGAYGMPLAAHCKRIGKKSVHLGGQTQLLFGIKGKRWETGHDEIKRMFNEHWVYPGELDRPKNYVAVEGGAYW